jgi:hypoxanthine phosphoribosyltransferase
MTNILLTKEQIFDIVKWMSIDIEDYYRDIDEVILITILEGAKYFSNDLLKFLTPKYKQCFLKSNSYNGMGTTGKINVDLSILEEIRNKNILLVDDIYDTGKTLDYIKKEIEYLGCHDCQCAVLIERSHKHDHNVPVRFVGKKIRIDDFLVGYGLDLNGKQRELEYIYTLKND